MNRAKSCLLVFSLVCFSIPARASPPNTILLDGRPTEYDGVDLRGSFEGVPIWSGNMISNLFVTWDATYLYVALQAWESDNKMVVLLDVDPDAGTGATTTTNWVGVDPDIIKWNCVGWRASDQAGAEAFGLDYMLASEGYYNDVMRILYDGIQIPDSNTVINIFPGIGGNGNVPRGTPVDMVVQADATACPLKGFETRIPWSVLYEGTRFGTVAPGEMVPRGARLRLFANLHNNDPNSSYSAPDAIPAQTNVAAGGGWTAGLLTTANYITLDVDANEDGFPDLAIGDVNAPFLRAVAGVAGRTTVYARFNEPVTLETVTNTANWQVGAQTPDRVDPINDTTVLLTLPLGLPPTGTLVRVASVNVQDASGNSKDTYLCLFPAAAGISNALTVRFILQTASGLGVSPGASAFHLNGSAEPLEWGYPPATSTPLAVYSGSLYYRDVTFPPGTPPRLYYKYSGILNNTGTNNYEAIRLHNYADAARWLQLNDEGTSLVVTDYLGAAAHPWREPGSITNYNALYSDLRRGDAGVRERTTVTFQLDLSARDLYTVQRVVLVGSDPLRGFNTDNTPLSDWPGNLSLVGWDLGGIDLYDDGTSGDAIAGDGIYSRTWSFTTNGLDPALVPGSPHSLVGGDSSSIPYAGGWANRRSPRSFAYKFAVVFGNESALLDPGPDIEVYLGADQTNVVMAPHLWANNDLPYRPPANPPQLVGIQPRGGTTLVFFTNAIPEPIHGIQISTNLQSDWLDFGQMASGSGGNWTAVVRHATAAEFYRAYSGPGQPFRHVRWSPNPIPNTGAVVRFWYYQNQRALAGRRDIHWYGNTGYYTSGIPFFLNPMTFTGDGAWYIDQAIPPIAGTNTAGHIQFLFTDAVPSIYDKNGGTGGNDYRAQYAGRATWTPDPVAPGAILSITYNTAGGPLVGATSLYLHVAFDGWEGSGWQGIINNPRPALTEVGGGIWTIDLEVPTNRFRTVNFCFTTLPTTDAGTWDNNGLRDWQAFIQP